MRLMVQMLMISFVQVVVFSALGDEKLRGSIPPIWVSIKIKFILSE